MLARIWRIIVGFVLTLAMLATLLACAITFSARSFQHNFAQITGNQTGVVSLSAIARLKLKLDELELRKAPLQAQLDQLEGERDAYATRYLEAESNARDRAEKLDEALRDLEGRLDVAISGGLTPERLSARLQTLTQRTGLDGQGQAALQAAAKLLRELNGFNSEASGASAARSGLDQDAANVQAELRALDEGAFSKDAAGMQNFDQVLAEIDSLRRTSPLGVALTLAQVHPAFLSTLLVCLAGALGSLLYLFPAYLTRAQKVGIDDVVVRLLFGMLTAFGFMIVANAANSLLGLGAVQAQAPQPSLNPFTIAGLGIVAGVMADDIAKWIHQRALYLINQGGTGRVLRTIESQTTLQVNAPNPATVRASQDVSENLGGLVNPHGGPFEPGG